MLTAPPVHTGQQVRERADLFIVKTKEEHLSFSFSLKNLSKNVVKRQRR